MFNKILDLLNPRRNYSRMMAVPSVPHHFRMDGKRFQRADFRGSTILVEQGEVGTDGEIRVLSRQVLSRVGAVPRTLSL